MSGLEMAMVGGVIVACLGMILAWLKTSRDQGDRDGRIETEIKSLNNKMDSMVKHQEDMLKNLQSQAKYCSGFTSRIDQRTITLEKEIFKR